MQNNIYTKNNKLIIEIPLKSERSNPYDPDFHEEMDNIIGVIDGQDYGFAYVIDMSYKGKDDQHSTIFYECFNSEDDFRKLCKKLKIEVIEYS